VLDLDVAEFLVSAAAAAPRFDPKRLGMFGREAVPQRLHPPVRHRGELFDGEHEGIIHEDVWSDVQRLLMTNRRERLHGARTRSPSLLTGLITDEDGRPMSPVFTTRSGRQHRYYVTRLKPGEDRKAAWRVPAGDLDRAVLSCVETALARRAPERMSDGVEETVRLVGCSVPEQRRMLLENNVTVQLKSSEIVVRFGPGMEKEIPISATFGRRGNELKLVLSSGPDTEGDTDPVLLKLVAHAFLAQEGALKGSLDPVVSGYSKRHLWQLLRVSWLAPDIVAAITEGRQPPTLTGRRLLRAADVPLSWDEQRRYFGFK
jgi:hypothetical protein